MTDSNFAYEPVVVLKDDIETVPTEDELRLLLQFMPELYRDMLILTENNKE